MILIASKIKSNIAQSVRYHGGFIIIFICLGLSVQTPVLFDP